MNQKKVKAIRKALRATGVNVLDAAYKTITHVCGDPRKPYHSYQNLLVLNCGRSVYQRAKTMDITRAAA